jgi:hypothetical protein
MNKTAHDNFYDFYEVRRSLLGFPFVDEVPLS